MFANFLLCFDIFVKEWYNKFKIRYFNIMAKTLDFAYLVANNKNKFASLITAIPAGFMSTVFMTYILMVNEGFKLLN